MKDNLVICKRCGGNACYEQQVDEKVTSWTCFGCGFATSTLFTEDSEPIKNALATSPELYKDLLFKDESELIWLPSTLTLPGKGMVFVDGTSVEDWNWAAVKAIALTSEEKKSGKFPKGQDFKMDTSKIEKFDKRDFMSAAEAIGMFEIE